MIILFRQYTFRQLKLRNLTYLELSDRMDVLQLCCTSIFLVKSHQHGW